MDQNARLAQLEARMAQLEDEVVQLKAAQGVVTIPFRVQTPEGRVVLEVTVNDVTGQGGGEVRLYDETGCAVLILRSEDGGGALLLYADENTAIGGMREVGGGGELSLYGQNHEVIVRLATPLGGGTLEISHDNGEVVLGSQFDGSGPALLIQNQYGDFMAYIGPGDGAGGRMRILDADGIGDHYFPPFSAAED
jgi:hypothetical protein